MRAERVTYRDDHLALDGGGVKFRLTYSGPLRPSQKNAIGGQPLPVAPHKMDIRRNFHRQLREFWKWHKLLGEHRSVPVHWNVDPMSIPQEMFNANGTVPFLEIVRRKYPGHGYEWVPLACKEFGVTVGLDILFLRRDGVGSALEVGDLDNRVKTLIDCLKRPKSPNEIAFTDRTPSADETPFFCLMEDDSLVSRLTVESDQLFEAPHARNTPEERDADDRYSHIVVTVEIRPYSGTLFSQIFA